MAVNIHKKAFLERFTFAMQGDKKSGTKRKQELTSKERIIYNLVFGLIVSLPLLNTLSGIIVLRGLKKAGVRNENDKARLGLAIVMTTGLSILLLPVLAIGTIARAIFNASQKDDKNKLYIECNV